MATLLKDKLSHKYKHNNKKNHQAIKRGGGNEREAEQRERGNLKKNI